MRSITCFSLSTLQLWVPCYSARNDCPALSNQSPSRWNCCLVGPVCLACSSNPAPRTLFESVLAVLGVSSPYAGKGTNVFLSRDSWGETLPRYLGCWLKPAPGASRTEASVFSQASDGELSKLWRPQCCLLTPPRRPSGTARASHTLCCSLFLLL